MNRPIAFNDGLCSIWQLKGRTLEKKLGQFDFKEETVGIKAYTEFNLIGKEVEKVISIPYNTLIKNGHIVVIEDEQHEIILCQKKDTFPLSWRLTLSKTPLRYSDAEV